MELRVMLSWNVAEDICKNKRLATKERRRSLRGLEGRAKKNVFMRKAFVGDDKMMHRFFYAPS
jgi:hypothetical protein